MCIVLGWYRLRSNFWKIIFDQKVLRDYADSFFHRDVYLVCSEDEMLCHRSFFLS